MSAKILIVDDHPIVVEGYRELINRQSDLEVCGDASSVTEALEAAATTVPDLALVDLMLKDSDGLELVKELRARFPDIKALVVSARDEAVFAKKALKAGASGYLSKEEAIERLVDSIRAALRGEVSLSPQMAARLSPTGDDAESG